MPQLCDVLTVVGLAVLGTGLWLWSPPLALTLVGALLLSAGVYGARKAR